MTTYRYCPQCAKPLEKQPGMGGEVHPMCPDGHFTYYGNPAPCAGAAITKNGKYLALKRAHAPSQGKWNLPGGFIQAGESAEEAVTREVKEETGLDVEPVRYLGSFASKYGETGSHTVAAGYLCEIIGGSLKISSESSRHEWFSLSDMPRMAHRDDQLVVERMREIGL